MAFEDSEFQTELRGYKRSEVDEVINELRTELIQSSKDRQSALEELKIATASLAALQASGAEAASPTYSGLGARLEAVLRIAEEQSTRVIGQADIDAEHISAKAILEATETTEAALREAQRIIDDATNAATNTLDGAKAKAEATIAEITAESKRLRAQAIDEAAAIRGAVATESAKLRASTKRETAALRAEAMREISEQKVVASRALNKARATASNLAKEIRVERASHELTLRKIQEEAALLKTTIAHEDVETTVRLAVDKENLASELAHTAEQARVDLEAELSARRAEAERELLDTHQKAVELNNRFLQEADNQLSETKARLAGLRKEHEKLIAAIDVANRTGKNSAQKAARETIAAAEARAALLILQAEEEATNRVAAAERRLVELRAERNTIADYIESLRTVVGEAFAVTKPPKSVRSAPAKQASSRKAVKQPDSAAS
jgi:cell division septum initiation protein DivIVA